MGQFTSISMTTFNETMSLFFFGLSNLFHFTMAKLKTHKQASARQQPGWNNYNDKVCTDLFEILLNQPEIRLYLPCTD